MGDWKPLSWQEIIETHVVLLTSLQKKLLFFPTKRQMIKCWIFPNTLVECGRWSIIGSRIVPSSQKLATFCHHPSVQIKNTRPCKSKGSWKSDNLKSKIGFTGPCSGLRIQTYWSNRVNNWRGQLNGENMSWIKQLALERAYLQLNGSPIYMQLNAGAGANYTSCSN